MAKGANKAHFTRIVLPENFLPWSAVEDKYESINRKELSGPAANIEEIFWSESVPAVAR